MLDIINAQTKNSINVFLNRYFSAIAIAAAVVILIFGNLFFIWPKYKQITDNIESSGKEEGLKYAKRQKYLSQLKGLKAEYQKINQNDVKKIKIMLPAANNREKLLAQMENLISKSGFLLANLHIEDASLEQEDTAAAAKKKGADIANPAITITVKKVKINMDVVGTDYNGLKRLLGIIENNLRLMDITNLSFDQKGNRTSLEMYAYYAN